MKKYLVATHGTFAEGIKQSVKIIAGEYYANKLQTVCAFVDDKDFTNEIELFIDSLVQDDQGIIFTDLYGGSVNQKVTLLRQSSDKNIEIISGINLPLLLEIVLNADEVQTHEELDELLQLGRQEIKFSPSEELNCLDIKDSEFFD